LKGLLVNSDNQLKPFECHHCYASVKLLWEYSEQEPDNVYCPNCGRQRDIDELDFDTLDMDQDDINDWYDE
jgi:Zn finger protein HypA/HybF involved in hydrogenase expression